MTDQTPPTLAEILAACLAVQAIYAARDAAAVAQAAPRQQLDARAHLGDGDSAARELEPADP